MKEWKLGEAQQCLVEVVSQAKLCGPQWVGGPEGEAVVLSADDFERLLADSGLSETDLCRDDGALKGEPVSFLEFMQKVAARGSHAIGRMAMGLGRRHSVLGAARRCGFCLIPTCSPRRCGRAPTQA